MRKPLKYLLITSGALIVLFLGLFAIVAAMFDPNDYKPTIIKLVQQKTQRTLAIPGEIKLTFFPKIGADLGKVSLSEQNGTEQFASVDRAQVSLELLPMLSKRFVVDRVTVDGLNVSVRKRKDGTTNIDDLLAPGEKKESQQVELDIDGVTVTNAALAYRDDQAGRTVTVTDLHLTTGPIADGKESTVDLTGQLTESSTKTAVKLDVESGMTLDLAQKRYVIEGLKARVDGRAMGYDTLQVTAEGNADMQAATSEFTLADLRLGFAGKQVAQAIDVKLAIPRLALTRDKISGSGVTGGGQLVSGERTVDFKLAAPGFEGSPEAFDIASVTVDATVTGPGLKATAKLTGPFSGQIDKLLFRSPQLAMTLEGQQGNLPIKGAVRTALTADLASQRIDLGRLGIDLVLPNPSGGTVAFKASGEASANLAKEAMQAALNGTLDGADLALQLGMTGFSEPAYRFDAKIGSLDLDRYMEQKSAAAALGKPEVKPDAKSVAPEPIDLSALKGLNATGTIQIGALKVSNIKVANLRADLNAARGLAEIRPLSASLYGGALTGSVSATAAEQPRFTIKQTLSGINIGPLLKDVADKDLLDGRGDVVLDLTAAGGTVDDLKKAVGGSARLSLRDGAIRGVNIAAAIRQAKAKIGAASGGAVSAGSQTGSANAVEKTDFTALTGSFRIANGVARNDDLEVKSPLLRITGAGEVNIGQDRLDYLVKANVVSTLQGQGGPELQALRGVTVPVRLTGPYDAIAWNVDVAGMAAELAKAKVDEKKKEVIGEVQKRVDEQKGKITEELGGRMKGLFGK